MCEEPEGPRDYLAALNPGGWLWFLVEAEQSQGLDLRRVVRETPREAIPWLIRALGLGCVDAQDRARIAYCLGQLGYSAALPILREMEAQELVEGVRVAAAASIQAILEAPAEGGFGQIERRRILDAARKEG